MCAVLPLSVVGGSADAAVTCYTVESVISKFHVFSAVLHRKVAGAPAVARAGAFRRALAGLAVTSVAERLVTLLPCVACSALGAAARVSLFSTSSSSPCVTVGSECV